MVGSKHVDVVQKFDIPFLVASNAGGMRLSENDHKFIATTFPECPNTQIECPNTNNKLGEGMDTHRVGHKDMSRISRRPHPPHQWVWSTTKILFAYFIFVIKCFVRGEVAMVTFHLVYKIRSKHSRYLF